MLGLMTKKRGMTQIFDEEGSAIPVTVLEVLENVIIQKKSSNEKDGYNAIQIGSVEEEKEQRLTKAEVNHCKKKELKVFRELKEFRVDESFIQKYNVGDVLNPEEVLGQKGALLEATSRPKGKGTTGGIKRWHHHRRPMSHGAKHHRHIGSAGAGTTPGRVFKGKHMPGRDSNDVTIPNLELVSYNSEHGFILVKGAVAGAKNSLVILKAAKPKKGWNAHAVKVGKRKLNSAR